MTPLASLDARLSATVAAYQDAYDREDLEAAAVLYAELDQLLDDRLHLPLQHDHAHAVE